MAETFCVLNQKGGVGKTTTSVNVSGILATRGYKVLLADSDPQKSNATYFCGLLTDKLPGLYDVLFEGKTVKEVVRPTGIQGLDILPSTSKLRDADGKLSLIKMGKEFILANALRNVKDDYDFIIIDSPPRYDNVTVNDLVASDYILLPAIPDDLSFVEICDMTELLENVRRYCNPKLTNLGILITMAENTSVKKAYAAELLKGEAFPCLSTVIRKNTKLQEAVPAHQPIHLYEPESSGSVDYNKLVDELLTKISETVSTPL